MMSTKNPTTNQHIPVLSLVWDYWPILQSLPCKVTQIPLLCNFFVQHAYPPPKSHASVAALPVASFQGSLMNQSGTGATGLSQSPMAAPPMLLIPTQGHSQVNHHGLSRVNSGCNTLGVGASFIPFFHTSTLENLSICTAMASISCYISFTSQ